MPTIEFNLLPEATRLRLLASLAGRSAPALLHEERVSIRFPVTRSLVLLASSLLGMASLVAWGFGVPGSPGAESRLALLPAWCGLAFLATGSLLDLLAHALRRAGLPWSPGRYLLASALVDARSPRLEVLPLRELQEVRHTLLGGLGGRVRLDLVFPGPRIESFLLPDAQAAVRIERTVEMGLSALLAPPGEREVAIRETMAPLLEGRTATDARPLSNPRPRARGLPLLLRRPLLLALGLAPPLGLLLHQVRADANDRALVRAIEARPSAEEILWYAHHGGLEAERFLSELLPRVRYEEALRTGSHEALRGVRREFPCSPEAELADDALGRAYAVVHDAFYLNVSTRDPDFLAAFRESLDDLRDGDAPDFRLRAPPPSVDWLAQAEGLLQRKSPRRESLPVLPASPFLGPEDTAFLGEAVARGLRAAFAVLAPEDLLRLDHVPDERSMASRLGVAPPEPDRPTLSVHTRFTPSGRVFSLPRDDRRFTGLALEYLLVVELPGRGQRWTGRGSVQAATEAGEEDWDPTREGVAARVYGTLARRLAEGLVAEIRDTFFQPSSPASRAMSSR